LNDGLSVQVGEWNNVKNLSIGFSGSYEVEPNNPRVEDLVSWSNILQNSQSQPPSQLNKSRYQKIFQRDASHNKWKQKLNKNKF